MVAWGPDAEVLDMLGGGLRGDVRQVRVEQRMAVGRLSSRSRASLDWELHLLHELAGAGLRVPSVIPTASGARRNDHMVITEWIPARGVTADDDARRARYLHRMHELTADWSQRPGSRTARELLIMDIGGDINMAASYPSRWLRRAGSPGRRCPPDRCAPCTATSIPRTASSPTTETSC